MYEFELSSELIAQEPASPRDHARLLVYDRNTKKISDDYFYNVVRYLNPRTCVVVNNTKVNHCRYLFDKGKTEIFVIEAVNDKTVRAMVRPGRKFKVGTHVDLGNSLTAHITAIDGDGIRTIEFSVPRDNSRLIHASHVPLPPYIKQNDELALEYQTIYAKKEGSLAAPTAGLHFTDLLRKKVTEEFGWEEVTLDVGLGTFAPLREENFVSNTLHEEKYEIREDVYARIMSSTHITAVGTTSLRTLESAAHTGNISGVTDIFITPGYEFKRVNSLITNFHLPSTSLLLLVEAFLGSRESLEEIYNHAIKERYRFYSFGDAMIIL